MTKRSAINTLLVWVVSLSFVLAGCGAGHESTPQTNPSATVWGVAAAGAAISGTVTLTDASTPPHVKTAPTNAGGHFTIDVTSLTPPYILRADWTDNGVANQMYALAAGPGRVNINPFSNAAFAAAGMADPSALSHGPTPAMLRDGEYSESSSFIEQLMEKLAPLFAQFGTSQNPVSDAFEADHTGLDALFDAVTISVSNGTILVTNKATGGVIFTAPVNNLDSGVFRPENMPGAPTSGGTTPTPVTCTYTYDAWGACQSNNTQTRNLLSSSPAGCSGTPVLTQACTYVQPTPAPCTYTYGAWGACLSSGNQVRSLLSSSPAGCTGTPVLTQACTYVPPVTTCSSFTYSAWGACQSDNTQTRTVTSSSPAGCTGGTPVLTQACTYVPPVTTCSSFTYDVWGACQSDNTQTRTVTSSSPAGCIGGTPVLSQSCTYVPPTCTYTYNAWGACQSNNTQTRTVASSSPIGCTGTPVLTQVCTYVPPTPTITNANVTASCTGCHGLTVNTTVFNSGGYTVIGRSAQNWLTTVNTMVGYGASLTPAGVTAQDYANYLSVLP